MLLYIFAIIALVLSTSLRDKPNTSNNKLTSNNDVKMIGRYNIVDNVLMLVELGNIWKYHIYDCIDQIKLFCDNIRIIFICDSDIVEKYVREIKDVEVFRCTYDDEDIKIRKILGGGLGFGSKWRFIALEKCMNKLNINRCLHMEHDNLIYTNIDKIIQTCCELYDIKVAVPQDHSNRCIASFIYIGSLYAISHITSYMKDMNEANTTEMAMLAKLIRDTDIIEPLPVVPKGHQSKLDRYQIEFGGIFDAAAIGQWVGGIDIIHSTNDTRGFINETSDYNMNEFKFIWKINSNGLRVPHIKYNNSTIPIFNLHIHSKQLHLYLSAFKMDIDDVIQGNRFKELANDIFHTVEDIDTSADAIKGPIVYVKTDLLDMFIEKCTHKIKNIVLITHNADHCVLEKHRDFANNPNIIKWFAQNNQLECEKVVEIPIGLANSEWEHGQVSVLDKIWKKCIEKKRQIYINLGNTHPSRKKFGDNLISKYNNYVLNESNVSYEQFLSNISKCLYSASPQGNGPDTHRFWESLYLGTIPVTDDGNYKYKGLFIAKVPRLNGSDINMGQDPYFLWKSFNGRYLLRMSYWRSIILGYTVLSNV